MSTDGLNDTSEEEFADVLGKYSSDESGSRGASPRKRQKLSLEQVLRRELRLITDMFTDLQKVDAEKEKEELVEEVSQFRVGIVAKYINVCSAKLNTTKIPATAHTIPDEQAATVMMPDDEAASDPFRKN